MSGRRETPEGFDESTEVTHHDEGVSFEVTLQHGSASDRVRVKSKLKTETDDEFAAKRESFVGEVRAGAEDARDAHDDVFGDD